MTVRFEVEKAEVEWHLEEAKTSDFGDKRLSERFKKLLLGLSRQTELSIPGALGTWSETCSAYRFLSNGKVSSEKLFLPHKASTLERIKKEEIVLLAQDTSEINYSSKKDIEGLGPLNTKTHRGFLMHPVLAMTPERLCLGSLSNKMWVRESIGNKGPNRDRPIEEKESLRWLKGFEVAEETAKEAPETLIVSMADREGDIYEFFQLTDGVRESKGAHWLIRSCYNRVASKKEHGLNQGLWDVVRKREPAAKIEFELSNNHGENKVRPVTQEIRFARVKLGGARRKGKGLKPLTITAVLATEINVAAGEKPLEWLLVSSLPVSDGSGAVTLLKWYLCRWEIELFFKILKSGCRIEQLQLEHVERLFKCVTLYMIIAWRIMFIKSMGLKYPDKSCLAVFTESEWKAVYCKLYKKPPPDKPVSLAEMVILVARLGGFLARKRDGHPGIQTLWKGLQRMHDYAEAWECFHEK